MNQRLHLIIIWPLLLATISSATAHAGLIISVGDLTLDGGQAGMLDVTIRSDGARPDILSFFSFDLRITSSGPALLKFADAQPSPFAVADYVFLGDSSDATTGQPLGRVSSITSANDRYVGGDSTLSTSGVTVTGTSLLIPLLLQASPIPPAHGETFALSFNTAGTSFLDANLNPIAYSSSSGDVTIAGVPEPSSFILMCLSIPFVLLATVAQRHLRRRRLKPGRPIPSPSCEVNLGPVAVRA